MQLIQTKSIARRCKNCPWWNGHRPYMEGILIKKDFIILPKWPGLNGKKTPIIFLNRNYKYVFKAVSFNILMIFFYMMKYKIQRFTFFWNVMFIILTNHNLDLCFWGVFQIMHDTFSQNQQNEYYLIDKQKGIVYFRSKFKE